MFWRIWVVLDGCLGIATAYAQLDFVGCKRRSDQNNQIITRGWDIREVWRGGGRMGDDGGVGGGMTFMLLWEGLGEGPAVVGLGIIARTGVLGGGTCLSVVGVEWMGCADFVFFFLPRYT